MNLAICQGADGVHSVRKHSSRAAEYIRKYCYVCFVFTRIRGSRTFYSLHITAAVISRNKVRLVFQNVTYSGYAYRNNVFCSFNLLEYLSLKLSRSRCMPQDNTERMLVFLSLNLPLMRNEIRTNLGILVF